jgi:hypothetical protein
MGANIHSKLWVMVLFTCTRNTTTTVDNCRETQKLPSWLDCPNFSFRELHKIIIANNYAYKQYMVYVFHLPLLSPTVYHFYKLLSIPVTVQQERFAYSYIGFNKEILFSNPLKQHCDKMNTNELTGCFQPNEILYACRKEIHIPERDCKVVQLHPLSITIPSNFECRFFKFGSLCTWAVSGSFVTPQTETIMALNPKETTTLKLQKEGKLTLRVGWMSHMRKTWFNADQTGNPKWMNRSKHE